jgi:hypothetical protein
MCCKDYGPAACNSCVADECAVARKCMAGRTKLGAQGVHPNLLALGLSLCYAPPYRRYGVFCY